ncbi:glycosyltransferase family 25 protein [Halomonas aquamarina]|uniref:Glycosyltransferase family 25 protein n=1 Tax=Vreelandella aquamarina TaxID=77097 RepID=A0ACC5VRE1_9GAMM|nr:glycosyltransferase family 25 protein [Halomonas aquamarina]MBZ5486465.1 glycosyltransferase family 25 protein [Halomonas aquamarina]
MSFNHYCIYVLTMRDSKRIASIEEQMLKSSLNFEYVDAVVLKDDHNAYVNQQSVKENYGKELSRGEVGCYLSHKSIWEKVVLSNKASVIFEDDALIDKKIVNFLNRLSLSEVSYDVLILGHSKKDYRNKSLYHFLEPLKISEKVGEFLVGRGFKTWPSGTVGYIITPEGAKKLLSISEEINSVLDDWPYYERLGVLVKEVRPLLVWEDYINMESAIENERKTPARKNIYFVARILRGVLRNIIAGAKSKR